MIEGIFLLFALEYMRSLICENDYKMHSWDEDVYMNYLIGIILLVHNPNLLTRFSGKFYTTKDDFPCVCDLCV